MTPEEFKNRRDVIKEDFRVKVEKSGDQVSIDTEGQDSKEVLDFMRSVLGDNFEYFDCDWDACSAEEKVEDPEIPEVSFDYEEKENDADPEDAFNAFDDEKEPVQQMDMIDGKLVPAKDPTASEIDVEDEVEEPAVEAEEEIEDEEKEDLEEGLEDHQYNCYFDNEFVGVVTAKSEEDAALKMEKTWPELPYGSSDGIVEIELADDFDDAAFADELGEALYGKKELTEAGLGLKNKLKNFAAGVKRAFTTPKTLDNVVKLQVKELDKDNKEVKVYDAKSLAEAEKLAIAGSKKSNVEKAIVAAVDYIDDAKRAQYKDPNNAMLDLDPAQKKELALETFRNGSKSNLDAEKDVVKTFIDQLDAIEQTKVAEVKQEENPVEDQKAEQPAEDQSAEDQSKEVKPEAKETKGAVMNRKINRNKTIYDALKKAGFDVSDFYANKKASDKLNTLRKELFGEELREDYEPQSDEEKALWQLLSDNGCGPDFEYELTYDARDYENSKSEPGERRTYDGDYVPSGSTYVGTYRGSFWYDKTPTYQDVLDFLGEDHLTKEGAERFIADDKKKDSEFEEFLKDKYEDEAVDKFYDDLENGEYDDSMDWEEEWPEPDYYED